MSTNSIKYRKVTSRSDSYLFRILQSSSSFEVNPTHDVDSLYYFHIYISNYSLQTRNSLNYDKKNAKLISSLFITNLHRDYSMNCIYNSCVCWDERNEEIWNYEVKNSSDEKFAFAIQNIFNLLNFSLFCYAKVSWEMKMRYSNSTELFFLRKKMQN
jgi:hypothetical protein